VSFVGLAESIDPPPQEWADSALCAQTDPEVFFPEKGGITRPAKRICLGCPVRQECLDYALEHNERFGIWGGHSERERRRILRGVQPPKSQCRRGHDLGVGPCQKCIQGRRRGEYRAGTW
jgi:WhiB family transcriptional regulator, redox-sensing transcriptional regulator